MSTQPITTRERQERSRRSLEASREREAEQQRARCFEGPPANTMDFTDLLVEFLDLHSTGHRYSPRGQQLADELDRRSPADR